MADEAVCGTDCEHMLAPNDVRLALPEPDYSFIDFLPPPEELAVESAPAAESEPAIWRAAARANIPYAFGIGAVNFAGMLYIRGTNGKSTYTDGAFAGVVVGGYHIDRDHVQAHGNGPGVKAYILLDFQKKHAVAWIETLGTRCCGYRNWGKCDTWHASRQVVIGSW